MLVSHGLRDRNTEPQNTETEKEIFQYFIEKNGESWPYKKYLQTVWQTETRGQLKYSLFPKKMEEEEERVLDLCVGGLREKAEKEEEERREVEWFFVMDKLDQ